MDFLLQATLSIGCNHNLSNRTIFIDLVKDFDIVNHETLYLIFKHFGAPIKCIDNVRRACQNTRLIIKIGKSEGTLDVLEENLDQSAGVGQGLHSSAFVHYLYASIFKVA